MSFDQTKNAEENKWKEKGLHHTVAEEDALGKRIKYSVD